MSDKSLINEALYEELEFTVKYIRENSSHGKFIRYDDFFIDPINLKEEDKDVFFEKLISSDKYSDIKELKGKEKRYYYSDKKMTDSYAELLYKIEEKDILNMVAERIRNDSKRYPKTTNPVAFRHEPYNMKKEELSEILEQFKKNEDYSDIKESVASNGVACLYSNKFLTQNYADALTEFHEVTRVESQ